MRDSRTLLPTAPFVAAELLEPRAAIAAYRARIALAPLGVEDVDLDAALGRVLARDAVARDDHPSHARSTMDGFAIATAGGAGERRIVGEIRMGEPPPRAIARDETLRIPTGGALPAGADAVVPLEDVTDHGDRITIRELPPAGDCQTPRASDIRAGEAVIGAGRRIGGPELGVLATLGITRVPVYRRPRFAIVSTGDELIDPGETPRQGQVRDSNRYAIAGALRALGVDARHFPRAGDTPASLRAVLA
ncbi:MAG: molybdopterin molybdotransferase MoeA, partial [Vulcanimicrobiaceae bacterium]